MKFLLSFILIVQNYFCISQTATRRIVDKETNSPISYGTVKILHKPVGIIASDKGEFDLVIEASDSVLFSCAGYQQKILLGKEIESIIYLDKKIKTLQEVTMRNGKIVRTIVLGNGVDYLKTRIRCRADETGIKDDCWPWGPSHTTDEFAERIDLPDSNLYYKIKKVIIPVRDKCTTPFLLHIYVADTDSDKPGEEILMKPVSVDKVIKYHKGVFDISLENITLHGIKSVFIGFSWIRLRYDESGKRQCIPTILMKRSTKTTTYSRTISSDNYHWFHFVWRKEKSDTIQLNTLYSVELDVIK